MSVNRVRAVGRKAGDLIAAWVMVTVVALMMISSTLWYVHDLEAFGLKVLHFFGIARNWVLPEPPGGNPWAQ
jgi:hypothetical protein